MRKIWQPLCILVISVIFCPSGNATSSKLDFTTADVQKKYAEAKPEVGKAAATKYFQKRQVASETSALSHYLSLHIGGYTDSAAYVWGHREKVEDPADQTIGFTYLMGEWSSAMDLNLRVDFNTFNIDNEKPLKMSLLPLVTFPEVGAQFPLYFGLGIGIGVFFKQVDEESSLSLDYQLLVGARFLNVFGNTGFFIESGLKNHIHLLSDGQLNGVFVSAGVVFLF